MRTPRFVLALASLTALAAAQEHYWIANRGTADAMSVSSCGVVQNTVPLGTALRSAHVAPDGKIWIVRFIQSQFDILNPDGTIHSSPVAALGSAYSIAFDRAGHAWVSGGTGVEEFDANGVSLNTYPLPAAAPLGIAVDADGNKWIAHRVGPPGSISRIDGMTGAITNHPLPATSLILPVQLCADFRGIGNSSHIWVVGDNRGAGELVEFDAAGNALNTYVLDLAGRFTPVIADVDPVAMSVGDVWVADWGNGNVYQVDSGTGVPSATFLAGTGIHGLSIDGFQNLWATDRTNTEVRRYDRATGTFEVAAKVGSLVGSALSTRWAYATVVDPLGDLDADGTPNIFDVVGGSSPFDACSTPAASLSAEGPTGIGTTATLRVVAAIGAPTGIAFGLGATAAGFSLPGFTCSFRLAPVIPVSLTTTGPTDVTLPIPPDPGLVGLTLYAQGINPAAGAFTNIVCFAIY